MTGAEQLVDGVALEGDALGAFGVPRGVEEHVGGVAMAGAGLGLAEADPGGLGGVGVGDAQPQRPREQGGGTLEVEGLLGLPGGAAGVVAGGGSLPGLLPVLGEDLGVAVGADGLGEGTVQAGEVVAAEQRGEALADAVVGALDGLATTGGEQPLHGEGGDGPCGGVRSADAGRLQGDGGVERAGGDGDHLEQGSGVVRQALHASGDQAVEELDVVGVVAGLDRLVPRQPAADLLEVEGGSLGLVHDPLHQPRVVDEGGGEPAGLGVGEGTDRDDDGVVLLEGGEELGHARVVVPVAEHEGAGHHRAAGEQPGQDPQAGEVGPLQVVDPQDERTLGRHLEEQLPQGRDGTITQRDGVAVVVARDRAREAREGGEQARGAAQIRGQGGALGLVHQDVDEGVHQGVDGLERGLLALVAAAGEDDGAVVLGVAGA